MPQDQMLNHAAFCADIGSIPGNKFGWASSIDGELKTETHIELFAAEIAKAINSERKVSIGFECPLFVPVRDEPRFVAAARRGEGQRSWSAGAGTAALATGMVQSLWVMRRVKTILGFAPKPTFDWAEFKRTHSVFLWEAFVTSTAKAPTHYQDAEAALRQFLASIDNLEYANAINESTVMSLIGACAIRAGWSEDIGILSRSCLVIRA